MGLGEEVVRASPLSLNRHSGAGFECQPPDVSSVRFRRSVFSTAQHSSTPSSTVFGNFAFKHFSRTSCPQGGTLISYTDNY